MIGPAGAGKTTLLRALAAGDPGIRGALVLDRATHLRCAASCLARFGPELVGRQGVDRGRLRSMTYVEGWHRVLAGGRAPGWAILLDHGPLYRLAQLGDGAGPALSRWCGDWAERWAARLDLVVWLDAPTATLEERIRTRERWHLLKDRPAAEWAGLLGAHRGRLEELARAATATDPAALLRFDTSALRPEQLAGDVRHALEARRAGLTV